MSLEANLIEVPDKHQLFKVHLNSLSVVASATLAYRTGH
jgi:hypothetical protein